MCVCVCARGVGEGVKQRPEVCADYQVFVLLLHLCECFPLTHGQDYTVHVRLSKLQYNCLQRAVERIYMYTLKGVTRTCTCLLPLNSLLLVHMCNVCSWLCVYCLPFFTKLVCYTHECPPIYMYNMQESSLPLNQFVAT